jgi:hypothetical protein
MDSIITKFIEKSKRQTEILALCLSKSPDEKISISDMSFCFGVEELTIKRDLCYLRSLGLDIHSSKKDGLAIYRKADKSIIQSLFYEYALLKSVESNHELSPALFTILKDYKSSLKFVVLQYCMSKKIKIKVKFNGHCGYCKKDLSINPHYLKFINEKLKLFTEINGYQMNYDFEKISFVVPTNSNFEIINKKEKLTLNEKLTIREDMKPYYFDKKLSVIKNNYSQVH